MKKRRKKDSSTFVDKLIGFIAVFFIVVIGISLVDTLLSFISPKPKYISYAIINGEKVEITGSVYDLGSTQQQYLRKLITETTTSSKNAASDSRKKKIWINASQKLCESTEFNARGLKENWFGIIDKNRMADNGIITLRIKIDNSGNAVEDNSVDINLEKTALDLKFYQIVRFSGYFVEGNKSENECLSGGFDSNPELYDENFRFILTHIEPIERVTEKVY